MSESKEPLSPDSPEALRRLTTTQPQPEACAICQEQLDAYIADQLAGREYTRLHPETALHLDHCTVCAEAYAALYELTLAEQAGPLPMPANAPEPDISFLTPERSLQESLRQALARSRERLVLQLNERLLPLLRPPAAALAVRSDEAGRYHEKLLELLPEQGPDSAPLPLGLTAYRDSQQPDFCLLEIMAQPPGRSWPNLAGQTVLLEAPSLRRSAVTDAWGVAAFEDIPIALLPHLRIELR